MQSVILNRTTNEWIDSVDGLKTLLKPLSKKDVLLKEDVGESRWKRTDRIILVPEHLKQYVRAYYSGICLE